MDEAVRNLISARGLKKGKFIDFIPQVGEISLFRLLLQKA